jgi:hypothetical protein
VVDVVDVCTEVDVVVVEDVVDVDVDEGGDAVDEVAVDIDVGEVATVTEVIGLVVVVVVDNNVVVIEDERVDAVIGIVVVAGVDIEVSEGDSVDDVLDFVVVNGEGEDMDDLVGIVIVFHADVEVSENEDVNGLVTNNMNDVSSNDPVDWFCTVVCVVFIACVFVGIVRADDSTDSGVKTVVVVICSFSRGRIDLLLFQLASK